MKTAILVPLLALIASSTTADAQRRCTKGIPCGNSCIAANKTCRIGPPTDRPPATKEKEASPSTLAAPVTPPPPVNSDSRLPWVGDTHFNVYYANGCTGGERVASWYKTYSKTEGELRKRGFRRATQAEEACDSAGIRLHAVKLASALEEGAGYSVRIDTNFVGSVADKIFFRRTCTAAQDVATSNRVMFVSERDATAAGYRRSRVQGC